MVYRVSQIKLKLNEDKSSLKSKLEKKFGCRINELKIVKESIDARDKGDIRRVYTLDFACDKKLKLAEAPDESYKLPEPGPVTKADIEACMRPVVVGFGPCGMFAALTLARAGLKPLVLERGYDVDRRSEAVKHFWETGELNPECNVQFGEGGAGTFSDGKLTTGIKDSRIREVLDTFIRCGAPEEIGYSAKPHVGTDVLRVVVKNLRNEIIDLGGEIRFGCRVTGIEAKNGVLTALTVQNEELPQNVEKTAENVDFRPKNGNISVRDERIRTDVAIFAIGHSSRDTFRELNATGVLMVQKPFSIGVRIEHDQDIIDIAQYGKPAKELGLPAADYKLSTRLSDGRGVYTFCMCPGGEVINASSAPGMVATNGMSLNGRDSGKANSALLVDVRTEDFGSEDALAGVDFQEKYEALAFKNGGSNYSLPKATWGEVTDGRAKNIIESLPEFAVLSLLEAMPAFGRRLKGFDDPESVVYAVESRSSSPVRFPRDEAYAGKTVNGASLEGFYPAGEGAGYAGGIMSAAVDGIRVAEAIIKR